MEAFAGSAKIIEDYLRSWGMATDKVVSVGEAYETLKRQDPATRQFDVVIIEQFTQSLEKLRSGKCGQRGSDTGKDKAYLVHHKRT